MEELKKRSEIKKEDKWDIEKIYKNSEEWEKAFETLKKEGIKIKEYEGKLNDSETLLEFLKLDEKISREAEKILVYSHLKSDENTGDNQNQGRMNKADSYMAELSSYGAFFIPEILSIGEEYINKMLNVKEELKLYDLILL